MGWIKKHEGSLATGTNFPLKKYLGSLERLYTIIYFVQQLYKVGLISQCPHNTRVTLARKTCFDTVLGRGIGHLQECVINVIIQV
jgi:hypothetical protein